MNLLIRSAKRVLRNSCCSARRTAEGVRPRQGLEVDRRHAFFRFAGLERRVGQSGAVSVGRTAPATFVAGVPPDYFSAQGQLWGNPVYNWDSLRQSGYRWWIDRLRSLLTHVDVIRLDHFRAFAAAWQVPAGAPTAQSGKWVPGPGADFFRAVERELGRLPFIAEDLGLITPDVYALRDQFHLPGMRVLQFAFDGIPTTRIFPRTTSPTRWCTPAHTTIPRLAAGLRICRKTNERKSGNTLKGRGAKSGEAARALMELAWSSVAALAMAPLQDLLNLGREARMNVPGRPEGNWRWRCTEEMLSDPAFEWLRDLTKNVNRSKSLDSSRTQRCSRPRQKLECARCADGRLRAI